MEMTAVLALVLLAFYGWYMHKQGNKSGLTRGVFLGSAAVLSKQVYDKTLSRADAIKIMPSLTDEIIESYIQMFKNVSKNASIQP